MIGTDIIRYDIYGKDVRVANKVEKNGKEGKIVVSRKTKEIIEEKFPNTFVFKKFISLMIFGEEVQTYKIK